MLGTGARSGGNMQLQEEHFVVHWFILVVLRPVHHHSQTFPQQKDSGNGDSGADGRGSRTEARILGRSGSSYLLNRNSDFTERY